MSPSSGDPAAQSLWAQLGMLVRAHPWHGVPIGPDAPASVTCFIEIVPTDGVKYEIDKLTGYLKIDRPQKFSNLCPTLYGLIPQTFCGDAVAARAAETLARGPLEGDGDPLDICVLSEKTISHGDILLRARPIGGLRLLDGHEVDDKIIAVLHGDAIFDSWTDIEDCPRAAVTRLVHYFETYKLAPGTADRPCEVAAVYGRAEAHEVIRRSQQDYQARFGTLAALLERSRQG